MIDLFQARRESHEARELGHEFKIQEGGVSLEVPRVEGQAFYPSGDAPRMTRDGTPMENIKEGLAELPLAFGSAGAGLAAGAVGLPGDLVSLIGGLGSALFPGDQSRLEAFTTTMTDISEAIGSERFLGLYTDIVNNAGFSEEDKKMMLDVAEGSSFFSIPGAAAVAKGGVDTIRSGVVRAGEAAQARLDEAAGSTTLTSGVDVGKGIDQAIAAAGRQFADAQVRYFETGNFEPPTAENPVSVVRPTETEPGIIAFHGSGADFDEFRLEMIGTGEGAQAYGYGLYFTDSEDIAKFYRETVGKRKQGLPTSIPDDPNDVAGALAQDIGFKEGVFGDTGLLQINSGDPDYDFFIKMLDDNAVETTQAGVAKTYEFNDGSVITLSDEATPVFKGKALDSVYTSDVEYMFENEIQDIIKRAQEMGMPGDRASLRSDIVTVLSQLGQGLGSKRDMYTAVENLAPSYGGPPSRYMTIYNQFIEPNTDIQTVSTLTELGSKRGKIYKVGLSPKPDELLDYDLPLNQQPRVVQKQMENLVGDLLAGEPENYDRFDFKALAAIRGESPTEGYSPTGDDILTDLQRFLETGPNQSRRAAMDASKILNDFGIPGIKYRAAGSRGAGVTDEAAERNYVIFDDKAVKILEKYGIVGPVAITAAAAGQSNDNEEGAI